MPVNKKLEEASFKMKYESRLMLDKRIWEVENKIQELQQLLFTLKKQAGHLEGVKNAAM